MGDVADIMNDGTLCAECGQIIDDEEEGYAGAAGYPRYCGGCGGKPEANGQRPTQEKKNRRKRR